MNQTPVLDNIYAFKKNIETIINNHQIVLHFKDKYIRLFIDLKTKTKTICYVATENGNILNSLYKNNKIIGNISDINNPKLINYLNKFNKLIV